MERRYQETTINPQGRQFVRVEEYDWDEDGVKINVRNGFIECKPGAGASVAKKLTDGERIAVFGQLNRQNGLYAVAYLHKDAVTSPAGTLQTA